MPRSLVLLALTECTHLARVGALAPKPADPSLLEVAERSDGSDRIYYSGNRSAWARSPRRGKFLQLDVRGKTSLVLTFDDVGVPHDEDPRVLRIPFIRGQLGDSLRQLGWAIFFAEQHNFSTIDMTSKAYNEHFAGFIDIAENPTRVPGWKLRSIHVEPLPVGYTPSAKCWAGADFFQTDSLPSFFCGGFEAHEWARILRIYIKPLLVNKARVDEPATSGELVIHIRSGDAMTSNDPLAEMEVELPPCAMYDMIINEGHGSKPFQKVRVITQHDNFNPCIDEVQRRHPRQEVTVQRGSLNEDAAAIMNAEHLVLSPSFFSFFMSFMNENLKSVFYAKSEQITRHFPHGVVPCGATGDPDVYMLTVPGLSDARASLSQRQTWMSSYSIASLSLSRAC